MKRVQGMYRMTMTDYGLGPTVDPEGISSTTRKRLNAIERIKQEASLKKR